MNLKDCQRLLEENSKLKGALEDIASADETSTLHGAVAIARSTLDQTKRCAVTPPKSAGAGRFQAAMAGMKL